MACRTLVAPVAAAVTGREIPGWAGFAFSKAAMNGDENFLCHVVYGAVVHAQAADSAPHESERFLINLVECGAHHRRAGIRQGEMSDLIPRGKWNSEGQTAAFMKAAALQPTG